MSNEDSMNNETLPVDKTTSSGSPQIPPEEMAALQRLTARMQNPLVLQAMQEALEAVRKQGLTDEE